MVERIDILMLLSIGWFKAYFEVMHCIRIKQLIEVFR